MRGDKRCASFRQEKAAGLSRALSWLSVSSLSRQSRRIFHSQNELHSVHNRQTHSHPRLYAADRDGEEEDQDNWVYQPQHKTGEDLAGEGKSASQIRPIEYRPQMFYILPQVKHTHQHTHDMFILDASQRHHNRWIVVLPR